MYKAFENLTSLTKTRTSVRMFLDDPAKKDGVFDRYVSVILDGTMEVVTQPQTFTTWGDRGPVFILPWYVTDMPSEGDSILGKIRMNGNPDLQTTGIIRPNIATNPYPGTLIASVFQVLEVPGYGRLHNKYPVVVEGTVDSIPPFHTEAACRCAMLFDDDGVIRGTIGGRSLTILGPA